MQLLAGHILWWRMQRPRPCLTARGEGGGMSGGTQSMASATTNIYLSLHQCIHQSYAGCAHTSSCRTCCPTTCALQCALQCVTPGSMARGLHERRSRGLASSSRGCMTAQPQCAVQWTGCSSLP